MMKIVAVVGTILALGIGGWLLLKPSESIDDAQLPAHQESKPVATPESNEPSEPGPSNAAPIASSAFDPKVEEPATKEETSRIEASPLKGRLLKVVDKESRKPIPGALVMFGSQEMFGSQSNMWRYFAESRGLVDLIFQRGRLMRTDEEGNIRIPMDGAESMEVLIAARKGKLFGILDRKVMRKSEWIVEVTEGQSIKVIVRDENQQPVADVLVGLRYAFGPKEMEMGMDIIKASTDADGLAVLKHVEMTSTMIPGEMNCTVGIALPLAKPVSKKVSLKKIPSDPIALTMPAVRPVTVRIRRNDGSPPPQAVTVSLAKLPDQSSSLGMGLELPLLGAITAQTNENGDAVFPRVGKLLTWVAKAWHDDYPVESSTTHKTSQQSPIPDIISLNWNPKFPTYVARLLNPEGEPLANKLIGITNVDEMGSVAILRTDSEGNISYRSKPEADDERKIRVEVKQAKPPLRLSISLPPRVEGTYELGDLRMVASPRLASGVVLKPDGTPCPDAQVAMTLDLDSNESEFSPQMESMDHGSSATSTEQDGSFTLYYDLKGSGRLSLRASHDDFAATEPLNFQPGASDLVLKLGLTGTLSARVKVPESQLSESSFSFDLEQVGDRNSVRSFFPTMNYSEGTLELKWQALPLGRYTFTASHQLIHTRVARMGEPDSTPPNPLSIIVENIEIKEGTNEGSRLQQIDLNQLFRVLTFDAYSDSNQRIPGVFAEVTGPNYSYSSSETNSKGGISIIIPRHEANVTAKAEGYTPNDVPLGPGNQRVTLSKATKVIITLTDLPKDAKHAFAMLEGPDGFSKHVRLRATDTPGSFSGETTELGQGDFKVKLHWLKSKPSANRENRGWTDERIKQTPTITVVGGGGVQELTVSAKE